MHYSLMIVYEHKPINVETAVKESMSVYSIHQKYVPTAKFVREFLASELPTKFEEWIAEYEDAMKRLKNENPDHFKQNHPLETPEELAERARAENTPEEWAVIERDYSQNEDKTEYGYYMNPFAMQDGFAIGNRYNNMLLLKSGEEANFGEVEEIDWEKTEALANEAGYKFCTIAVLWKGLWFAPLGDYSLNNIMGFRETEKE